MRHGIMVFTFFLLLCLICPFSAFSHESASLHYRDYECVFNGYGDKVFERVVYSINNEIDNGFPALFREKIGSVPGNHRILGHGWALNDAIPKETLAYLSKAYPGREKEIIEVWRTIAGRITNSAMETGLPKGQAKAFASMIYDIHLLGDFEPDNRLVQNVLSPKSIVNNINKDAQILFKNNPKYARLIQRRLNLVLKQSGYKSNQIIAQNLMDELYQLRVGDMLKDSWDGALKMRYSIDRVVVANERLAQRTLSRVPGIKNAKTVSARSSLKRANFKKTSVSKKTWHAGLLTHDGKLLMAVEEGAGAALAVIAIDGGIATYQYLHGDILKPEFKEKMVDAAIKGTAVGTATGVSILLGATPGGFVVLAVGSGAYFLTDLALSVWHEHQAKKCLTIDDLSAYGIELDTVLDLPKDSIFQLETDSTLDL